MRLGTAQLQRASGNSLNYAMLPRALRGRAGPVLASSAAAQQGARAGVLRVYYLRKDRNTKVRERLVMSRRRASSDSDVQGASSDSDVQGFKIGHVVVGVVQNIKPYGAFIDIGGGVTGLLHISQITHQRLVNVEQVLAKGDEIKVMILQQDHERGRITLSTKKLEPSRGDMLFNPKLVFERAEEMAAAFRARLEAAQAAQLRTPRT